jgi:superfamily II DNA or RNA helicase
MAIQIHQQRYERQLAGLNKWKTAQDLGLSHSNGWGTLWWITGTGKTFAACTLANKMLERNSANQFIVVVPSDELEKQWHNEVKSFVKEEYIPNFRIYTVHKLVNLHKEGKLLQCDLLIADELHEYYTEERLKMFDGSFIYTKWCLGLTATYEDKDNRHQFIKDRLPVVDVIDEDEALREGYISKYIEYNVAIELNDKERENYEMFSKEIARTMSKFGGNGLELASKILCGNKLTGEEGKDISFRYAISKGWRKGMNINNEAEAEIIKHWSPNVIIGYAKTLMDAVRERKSLLYCARNKLFAAREIAIKFDKLKTICFSQSTAFADALANVVNDYYLTGENQQSPSKPCVVYHSKIDTIITIDPETGKQHKKGKTVLKREAIEAIRSGKARIISTASSLDKGFDVKDIRLAVTTSGTQNPTQYTQRKGRAVRVETSEEDITVLVINLYSKSTIDEKWLRGRQSKSKNVVYWVDKIEDINYNPRRNDTLNLL